jgi:hypothetical protein
MHGVASSLDRLGLGACSGECLLVICSTLGDSGERPVPIHSLSSAKIEVIDYSQSATTD